MASASNSSTYDARELYELKQRAVKYYSQNGVPQKMEEVMNSMFYDNPDDVYGHLATYFEQFAKPPVISNVNARVALDSKGQPTLQTEVYCTVKNAQKLVATTVSATPNSSLPENARPEDREEDDKTREGNLTAAMDLINGDLGQRLQGVDPTKQPEADSKLMAMYEELKVIEDERLAREAAQKAAEDPEGTSPTKDETASQTSKKGKNSGKPSVQGRKGKSKAPPVVITPDEPKEKLLPHAAAFSTASRAVCTSGAHVRDLPLFQHISSLRLEQTPSELCLPLPMVTIIQSGRPAPGKLNCVKEFMIVPSPKLSLQKGIQGIQQIFNYVAKSLALKGGAAARQVNDIGALCPTYDKAEQGLDILMEAMTNLELNPGEDFYIALNCAGHEIFDYEKGKYEVYGGQPKTPEDLVEFWSELLGRYPAVNAIIDPMRKADNEHWMRLCERISERCYVMGNHVWSRPGTLLTEELTEDFKTSGIVFKVDQINTVSDIINCAKKMEEAQNQIALTTCHGETTDTFLADLAVGLNARFIKLGGPIRGERVALLNRLLQIEDHLKRAGQLGEHGADSFPLITPPPLPEPEEGEETQEEEKKEEKGKKK